MIIFTPSQAEPRRQRIGKTEFIVQAYFCGFESIYYKLANLMENELEASPQPTPNTSIIPVDNDPA